MAEPAVRPGEGSKPKYDVTGLKARRPARSFSWKTALVVVWLAFSVALAVWWVIFGLHQLGQTSQILNQLRPELAADVARRHRMILSEGLTLVILLLLGGGSLLYYNLTEVRRALRVREFFAAFTHDLKTSLASLRLQAESLEEDLKDASDAKLLRRLVKDTVRLELQLENSLLLASPEDNSRLYIENVRLGPILQSMKHHWPELEIHTQGDASVTGDVRAIESIFKNLLQNAVVHGRSTRVDIAIKREGGRVHVRVQDNGRGFDGNPEQLGRMFHRHSTTSGSGLGLYLVSSLAQRLGGELHLCDVEQGFCVEIFLPEAKA